MSAIPTPTHGTTEVNPAGVPPAPPEAHPRAGGFSVVTDGRTLQRFAVLGRSRSGAFRLALVDAHGAVVGGEFESMQTDLAGLLRALGALGVRFG